MTMAVKRGLSVVMMGRDEERFLPLSLPPLFQVADEVIFVDTGSKDRTLTLVRDLGCQVFQQPWQSDFSAPKNYGLRKAGFSWILNVDCDEVLQNPEKVRRWLHALPIDDPTPAYIIGIDNLLADGNTYPMDALRFFRNDPRIQFFNPIHEGVADSIYRAWPDTPLPKGEIRLLHYGYQAGINQEKIARNIEILRQWVHSEPNTLYGTFKLGSNLCHRGEIEEGLFFLARAFSLLDEQENRGSYPFGQQLINEYCKQLIQTGQNQQAQQVKERVDSWSN
ncbi:MAG: glycosyltransferase [Magnetococcales bacterium]|nr:glycosyltransferase [Magnetococcales bacterium]